MSLQTIPAIKQGNLCFDRLPNETVSEIFTFLKTPDDDRTIILATTRVCKNWNDALREEREKAVSRMRLQTAHRELKLLNRYSPQLVRVFRNCHSPIWELPILNLGDWDRDYITFIKPADMNQSVMRFEGCRGRVGIALHIRTNDTENVLAIFKRFPDPENPSWAYAWGKDDLTIQKLYTNRHDENGHVGANVTDCPTCPFPGGGLVHDALISNLLTGQDPTFRLAEHEDVPQASPPRFFSRRTAAVTAIAVAMLSFFANYYLSSERS